MISTPEAHNNGEAPQSSPNELINFLKPVVFISKFIQLIPYIPWDEIPIEHINLCTENNLGDAEKTRYLNYIDKLNTDQKILLKHSGFMQFSLELRLHLFDEIGNQEGFKDWRKFEDYSDYIRKIAKHYSHLRILHFGTNYISRLSAIGKELLFVTSDALLKNDASF